MAAMWKSILILLPLLVWDTFAVNDPCTVPDDYQRVHESVPEDTILRTYTFPPTILPGHDSIYVRIDNNSLVLNKSLDLEADETLCKERNVVITYDCPNSATFTIFVLETDDFPPEFNSSEHNATVRELAPNGYQFYSLENTAYDPDCSDNKYLFYTWNNSNGYPFSLSIDGRITVNGFLDYETGPTEYTLPIFVENAKTGTATLVIKLIDVDDQDPTFDNSSYSLTVREEDSTIVGRWFNATPPVSAHDQDKDLPPDDVDPLWFQIIGEHKDILDINTKTGELQMLRMLDREVQNSYHIILKVHQERATYRSATATLTLTVTDVNDQRPLFDPSTYTIDIPEHLEHDYHVGAVSATDKDEGKNAEFQYVIVAGAEYFTIDANGILKVNNSTAIDRETIPQIEVIVRANETQPPFGDGNCTDVTCQARVIITLLDINDNSPDFIHDKFNFKINSGAIDTPVGRVNASDADEGDNARLSYKITSVLPANEYFKIDPNTADVKVLIHLPSEETYTCFVEACDNPADTNVRRCTSVPVLIEFNGNITFDTAPINASVKENSPKGTIVAKLKHPYEEYEIVQASPFVVDTNLLKTDGEIDYENTTYYNLTVKVKQGGNSREPFIVTVWVIDENDNAPVFEAPEYSFSVRDNAENGIVIGTVKANDKDSGENGKITYSIQGSQAQRDFSIDPEIGEITLRRTADLTVSQLFVEFIVTATDGGTPSLASSVPVKVFLVGDSGTVPIPAPAGKDVLLQDKDFLETELSGILDADVKMEDVKIIADTRSVIYISGRSTTVNSDLSAEVLAQKVADNWEAIDRLFDRYRTKAASEPETMTVPVIALICVAAVILVGSILAIAILCYKYDKAVRHKRLYDNLNRDMTIYETQEVKVDVDDDKSEDSQSEDQRLVEENGHLPNGSAFGMVNPAFSHDESEGEMTNPELNTIIPVETNVVIEDETLPKHEDDPESSGVEGDASPTSGSLMNFSDPENGEHEDAGRDTARQFVNNEVPEDITSPDPDYEAGENRDDGDNQSELPKSDYESEAGEDDSNLRESVPQDQHDPLNEDDRMLPPPTALGAVHDDGDAEDEAEEDDDLPTRFPRAPTPPLPPPPPSLTTEEEEDDAPEEPEPDYAKRVRFSEAVIEHVEDKPEPEAEPVDLEDTGEAHPTVEEITSPTEVGNESDDEIARFHFHVSTQMTAL